jgi:hypothetical protein
MKAARLEGFLNSNERFARGSDLRARRVGRLDTGAHAPNRRTLVLQRSRELDNMESNAMRVPDAIEPGLLAQARPFEPDPPSIDGACGRCGYRGAVYPGRYGGTRCAVCFGLQTGRMSRGELQ